MSDIKVQIHPEDIHQYLVTFEFPCYEYFNYSYESKSYNYAIGRWTRSVEQDSVACEWTDNSFKIYRGFAIYILNTFRLNLDEESIALLERDIYFEDDITESFDYDGLRDYQIDVVKTALKYRRSIVQIPTGSGKTEIIARIVIAYLEAGKKVLVTTGISKVIDEIKLRIWKYKPDMELPSYWDSEAKINIVYPNGFANSYSFDWNDPWFNDVDIVVSDETSGATSESAWAVLTAVKNQECRWIGFDATAEKEYADRLDIRNNLRCIHSESSCYIIGLFGMSWSFDKPKDYEVDIIDVSNVGLRAINEGLDENVTSESTIYRDICNYVFSYPAYIETVEYILRKYGKLFIPINNLDYINTMTDIFCEKYHVATITGEGYWSSKEDWITLERLKELTQENQIDLLLSSASGFKGLDFRGIPNVLLTLGSKASTVIQFVGRVARQKHFRVFAITAGGNWKIPIYTKTTIQQLNLILNYYEDCRINMKEDIYE